MTADKKLASPLLCLCPVVAWVTIAFCGPASAGATDDIAERKTKYRTQVNGVIRDILEVWRNPESQRWVAALPTPEEMVIHAREEGRLSSGATMRFLGETVLADQGVSAAERRLISARSDLAYCRIWLTRINLDPNGNLKIARHIDTIPWRSPLIKEFYHFPDFALIAGTRHAFFHTFTERYNGIQKLPYLAPQAMVESTDSEVVVHFLFTPDPYRWRDRPTEIRGGDILGNLDMGRFYGTNLDGGGKRTFQGPRVGFVLTFHLDGESKPRYFPRLIAAIQLTGVGDKDKFLEYTNKVLDERKPFVFVKDSLVFQHFDKRLPPRQDQLTALEYRSDSFREFDRADIEYRMSLKLVSLELDRLW